MRSGVIAMNEEDKTTIRLLIREELREASKSGLLLSDEQKRLVLEWLATHERRRKMLANIIQSAAGWLVIVIIGGLGIAVWHYLSHKFLKGG